MSKQFVIFGPLQQRFTNAAYVAGESNWSERVGRWITPLRMEVTRQDGTREWVDFWWYTDELELIDPPRGQLEPTCQPEQMSLFGGKL